MIFAFIRIFKRKKSKNQADNLKPISPPEEYANIPDQYCSTCEAFKSPEFYINDKKKTIFKRFARSSKKKDENTVIVKCSECHSDMTLQSAAEN